MTESCGYRRARAHPMPARAQVGQTGPRAARTRGEGRLWATRGLSGRGDGMVGPEQPARVVLRLDLAKAPVDRRGEQAAGLARLLHEVHVRLAGVVGGGRLHDPLE